MIESKDALEREKLALQNLYKIELMDMAIVKRYRVDLPPKVNLRLLALMPGDLKANNHIKLFNDLVIRIATNEKLMQLDDVFDIIRADMPGSGSMAPVISKISTSASMIA